MRLKPVQETDYSGGGMVNITVSISPDGNFCGDCPARPLIRESEYCSLVWSMKLSKAADSRCEWSDSEERFSRCKACLEAEQMCEKNSHDERMAPVQGYSAGIPWSLHLRAWDAYVAKYGRYQSAEGIAERSGFSVGELDVFVPGWRDEVSEIAKLEAEVARLKTMHCPECGNDIFTRRDTGGQQCLECGTAVGPFIAAAEERGAKMYAKFIADFYAITGADTEWFDRWLAARATLAGEEVES